MTDNRLEIILAAKDAAGPTFEKVTAQIAGLGKSIFSLNTVMAGMAGATGMGLVIDRSLQVTAELDRQAKMAGVQVEAFQELSYAAQQYQISQDALTDGLKELSLRSDEYVKTGAGSAKESFERLGYTQAQVNARLADTPALLSDIIARMQDLDTAAQIRIADELFGGTGGEQFVSMIQGGAKAFDDMRHAARDLGVVIDKDLVTQSVQAKKEIGALTTLLSAQFNSAVAALAPDIAKIASDVSDWVKSNKTFLSQNIPQYIGATRDAISDIVDIYNSVPSEISKAAGYGLIGTLLLGGPAGKGIAAIIIANEMLDKVGMGLDDLYEKHKKVMDLRNGFLEATMQKDTYYPEDGLLRFYKALGIEIDNVNKKFGIPDDLFASHQTDSPSKLQPSSGRGGTGGGGRTYTPIDNFIQENVSVPADPWGESYDIDSGYDAYVAGIQNIQLARNNELLALQKNIDLQNRLAEAMEDAYDIDYGGVTDGLYDIGKVAEDTGDIMKDAFSGWASSFSADLNDLLWQSDTTFEDIGRSFAKMVTQMVIQTSVVKPFVDNLTGDNGWIDMGLSSLAGLFNATGNAYGQNGLIAYANGGVFTNSIVSRPTFFAHGGGFGVMGEDGPEAILPLARVPGGDLGVKAAPGGKTAVNIEVNLVNNTGTQADVETTGARWDGEQWVLGIVLNAVGNNRGGFRDNLRAAVR